MKCPCCKQPLPEGADVDVLQDIPMSPREQQVLRVLVDAYPRAVRAQQIVNAMCGLDPSGGPDTVLNMVSVYIIRVRKRVEVYGWSIPRNNQGTRAPRLYRLERIETPE